MAGMKITGVGILVSCEFVGSAKPLPIVIFNSVNNEDVTPIFLNNLAE